MHSVPCRPIISNSGFYTENISAFLDFHLKPITAKVKSYIKDTKDFLRKLQNVPKLPVDVTYLKALDKPGEKTVSAESLIQLAELVLKNKIAMRFSECFKWGTNTSYAEWGIQKLELLRTIW